MRILVVVLCLLLLAAPASSTNRWLRPAYLGGSNDSSGVDSSTAWATLGYADSRLNAGDTLFVMGGVYISVPDSTSAHAADSFTNAESRQHFYRTSGGTAGSPIVIKAFGDSIAVIEGTGDIRGDSRYWIQLEGNVDWITFDGFSYLDPSEKYYLKFSGKTGWVRDDTDSLTSALRTDIRKAFLIDGESYIAEHIVFRGIEIDGNHPPGCIVYNTYNNVRGVRPVISGGAIRYGIHFTNATMDTIEDCYIHHIWYPTGDRENGFWSGDSSDRAQGCGEAIYLYSNTRLMYVANNVIEEAGHAGVTFGGYADGCEELTATRRGQTTLFSKFLNNTITNHWGGGVYVNVNSRWNLVEGNVMLHCGESTNKTKSALSVAGSCNVIRKNVVWAPDQNQTCFDMYSQYAVGQARACDSNFVYNNTIFGSNHTNFEMNLGGNTSCAYNSMIGNTIANNIFYKSDGYSVETASYTHPGWPAEITLWFLYATADQDWVTSGNALHPETTHFGGTRFLNNIICKDPTTVDWSTSKEIGGTNPYLVEYQESSVEGGSKRCFTLAYLHSIDTLAWKENLETNPKLVSEYPEDWGGTNNWWALQSISPCINAGTYIGDATGAWVEFLYSGYGWDSLSVVGSAPDIGAYEYPSILTAPTPGTFCR